MKKIIMILTIISASTAIMAVGAGEAIGKMKGGGMAISPWVGWNVPAGSAISSAKDQASDPANTSITDSSIGGISGGLDAYYGLNSLFSMGVSVSILQFSSSTGGTGTAPTSGSTLYVPAMVMGQITYPIPGQDGKIVAKAFGGFGYAFSISTGTVPAGVPDTTANEPAATIGLGGAYKVLDKLWLDAGFRAGLVMVGGLDPSAKVNWNLTPYLGATFQL